MLTKIVAISAFIGLIFYLMNRESKRNDVYNRTKLEDEQSFDDEHIDTHY